MTRVAGWASQGGVQEWQQWAGASSSRKDLQKTVQGEQSACLQLCRSHLDAQSSRHCTFPTLPLGR